MNYQDIFNFYLHVPIAVFEGTLNREIINSLYDLQIIPLVYIKDPKHPLFKQFSKMLKSQGVKEKLKLIILPIGFTKQFLA
jgi:hypothetical protein